MRKERVVVALSGGVDSAVAAGLLLKQGYDVEGVYLKNASEVVQRFVATSSCTWEDDLRSVQAVGKHLGIPVRSLNVESEYYERVIVPFVAEYSKGRTPNPDVLCNKFIKFGTFLKWARSHGAAAIASGHYARISEIQGHYTLHASRDHEKDQSYFLYTLSSSVLRHVRFPVGDVTKTVVRKLARIWGLPNADRPDSQGVCFVGDLNVRQFLTAAISDPPGPIVTSDGAYLGTHTGLSRFTIGQRHGLGIGGGTPYFVAAKNLTTQTLIVARGRSDPILFKPGLIGHETTWVNGSPPEQRFQCEARIRYRQPLIGATVTVSSRDRCKVVFNVPQRAIAPGQAVVFYDGENVLGGAVIEKSLQNIDMVYRTVPLP